MRLGYARCAGEPRLCGSLGVPTQAHREDANSNSVEQEANPDLASVSILLSSPPTKKGAGRADARKVASCDAVEMPIELAPRRGLAQGSRSIKRAPRQDHCAGLRRDETRVRQDRGRELTERSPRKPILSGASSLSDCRSMGAGRSSRRLTAAFWKII